MITLEMCSELYSSLIRFNKICKFKYSTTKNEAYLELVKKSNSYIEYLKYIDVNNIDFKAWENRLDGLYFRMRCVR